MTWDNNCSEKILAEADMEQKEIKVRQQAQDLDHMCSQRTSVRLENVNLPRGPQKETIDIRDEMLSSDPKNHLEGYPGINLASTRSRQEN